MSEYIMYLRKSRQDEPNETVEEVSGVTVEANETAV